MERILKFEVEMERETRVELATSTMARLRSTTELFPHAVKMKRDFNL